MSQDNSTSSSNRFSTIFTSTLLQSHQYNGTPPPPYQPAIPSTQISSYSGDTNNPEDDDRIITDESQTTNEPTLLLSDSEPTLSVNLSSAYKMISNTESQELLCMASLVTSDFIPENAKET
ncbi:35336_t:CDS:1, partial [Gigaspora margarita]